MLDYTGIKCPVCDKPFGKDDDVVVCPECGAPYHRACYQQVGNCMFQELHQQGKEWKPPLSSSFPGNAQDGAAPVVKDVECPVCGALNDHGSRYCNFCGAVLSDARETQNIPPTVQYQPPRQWDPNGGTVPPFAFDPMGGVSPAEPVENGVTFGDVSQLVKQNTSYYMPVFRYIKQTGRNKFSFSAFLFSGVWLLYRKQYKAGIFVTALNFCIYILYYCLSLFVTTPVMLDLMRQVNMDVNQGLMPTNEQTMAMAEIMSQDPTLMLKCCLPMLCMGLLLVVMIVVGVRGNKMYFRHCVSMVKAVKAAGGEDDLPAVLMERGGVNFSLSICVFVSTFLLTNVLPLLL